jgi:lysozyme family protein
MANLDISIAKTLVNEGGYVDSKNDPGGATKYGVTQKDMPGISIQDLTEAQATAYYQENYVKPLYTQIENQDTCDKLFDMGVLFGIGTAVRILQLTMGIKDSDGVFGPETLLITNEADQPSLLVSYKTNLVTHAFNIATANPSLRVFLAGWGRRINS